MSRAQLLAALDGYKPWDDREDSMARNLLRFVEENPDCFSRSLVSGHITGSAWIVDPTRSAVLLVYHGKLHRWLQPGGHCEAGETALEAAVREAQEETGVTAVQTLSADIFDIDVHPIPARKAEPEHLHYDVRYVFQAPRESELLVSPESREVRWVDLGDVERFNPEPSVIRMVQKTAALGRFETLPPRRTSS